MTIDPHGLLAHVEPDLVKIAYACSQSQPFQIIAGLRTVAQEQTNVADGASQTMHSRHLPDHNGVAAAFDFACLVDGCVSWDVALYAVVVANMKAAAAELDIPIQCGADWVTLKDYGHIQLPWAFCP